MVRLPYKNLIVSEGHFNVYVVSRHGMTFNEINLVHKRHQSKFSYLKCSFVSIPLFIPPSKPSSVRTEPESLSLGSFRFPDVPLLLS